VARERQGEGAPKSWGGVARRGAESVRGGRPGKDGGGPGGASSAWRDAVEAARESDGAERRPEAMEEWILVEEIRDEAEEAVGRSRGNGHGRPGPGHTLDYEDLTDADLERQMGRAVGSDLAERSAKRLRSAAADFEAERFGDAARTLKRLADQAPGLAAVRELYGLTLYRQGKWKLAVRELEAFRTLTGSAEQNPVLADSYRALRRWKKVDELWDELREASPSAELVTEGRIVTAGARSDRNDVKGAIKLMEDGWRFPKRPKAHHLRRAYVLADLYERAGDVSRARDLFSRVRSWDPDFADVRDRMRNLG
jgi:tetratricopeptide (TPR) repeat protein